MQMRTVNIHHYILHTYGHLNIKHKYFHIFYVFTHILLYVSAYIQYLVTMFSK